MRGSGSIKARDKVLHPRGSVMRTEKDGRDEQKGRHGKEEKVIEEGKKNLEKKWGKEKQ